MIKAALPMVLIGVFKALAFGAAAVILCSFTTLPIYVVAGVVVSIFAVTAYDTAKLKHEIQSLARAETRAKAAREQLKAEQPTDEVAAVTAKMLADEVGISVEDAKVWLDALYSDGVTEHELAEMAYKMKQRADANEKA